MTNRVVFTALCLSVLVGWPAGSARALPVLPASKADCIRGLIHPYRLGGRIDAPSHEDQNKDGKPGTSHLEPPRQKESACGSWRIGPLEVDPTQARFTLRNQLCSTRKSSARHEPTEHRTGALLLVHPGPGQSCAQGSFRCLHSAHFFARITGPVPLSIRKRLLGLVERNDRRLVSNPWREAQRMGPDGPRTGDSVPGHWRGSPGYGLRTDRPMLPIRPTTWLARPAVVLEWIIVFWFLFGLLALPRIVKISDMTRTDGLLLLAVTAVAIATRLWGAQFLPAGPNAHAYETIEELSRTAPHGFFWYGNGFWAFFDLIRYLAGHNGPVTTADLTLLSRTNEVLGALTVPALYLTARTLRLDRTAALAGAVILAVLPGHVRLSASESRFVLATAATVWSMALTASAVRNKSLISGAAALAGWILASQTRPEMIAVPLVVAPAAVVMAGGMKALWRPRILAAAGLFAALLFPWLSWVVHRALQGDGPVQMVTWHCVFHLRWAYLGTSDNVPAVTWFDGRFTPKILVAATLFGLMAAPWVHRTKQALFWSTGALAGLAAGACFRQEFNSIRLQLVAQPFLAVLAGMGVSGLAATIVRVAMPRRLADQTRNQPALRLRLEQTLGVIGSLAIGLLVWHGEKIIIRTITAPQAEFLFLESVLPSIPPRCEILYPKGPGIYHTYQPFFLSDAPKIRQRWVQIESWKSAELDPTRPCKLWYRPVACYAGGQEGRPVEAKPKSRVAVARAHLMRHPCSDLESRLILHPYRTTLVSAVSSWGESYPGRLLEIGFFTMERIPKAGSRQDDAPNRL